MKTTLIIILSILFCQEPKKQKEGKQYRSAETGRYVDKKNADSHKTTTVSETRKRK